jgi:transcriptional regulator with XRE-family HTH domain
MYMKTNRIMDEIRSTISPEMKLQMEMSVAIANRIYEILESKGMTQKELAQRLGKTETEVSRWLSGTHNMTLSTVCKISAALGKEIVTVPKRELEPELV